MSFIETLFPTDISEGSIGGAAFSTEITRLGSGYEQRNQNWDYPLERWNVAYGIKTKENFDTVRDFFYAMRGMAKGFRFRNPDDWQVTTTPSGDEIGIGDGSTEDFQLAKSYTAGSETFTRKITKPITGQVVVFNNGAPVGGPPIDYTTGIVTISPAPSSGDVISAIFNFDIPVRFDTDVFPQNFVTLNARSVELPIVEIRI